MNVVLFGLLINLFNLLLLFRFGFLFGVCFLLSFSLAVGFGVCLIIFLWFGLMLMGFVGFGIGFAVAVWLLCGESA